METANENKIKNSSRCEKIAELLKEQKELLTENIDLLEKGLKNAKLEVRVAKTEEGEEEIIMTKRAYKWLLYQSETLIEQQKRQLKEHK